MVPFAKIKRSRKFHGLQYPLFSFQVKWNPNRHSCHWLIAAGKSGLVRLINVNGAS
jgi:hypothetical protein